MCPSSTSTQEGFAFMSRRRVGCIVVGRAGARELLEAHAPSSERILGLVEDREHEGCQPPRSALRSSSAAASASSHVGAKISVLPANR